MIDQLTPEARMLANRWLVYFVAARVPFSGQDPEDVRSAGFIGLAEAAHKFDPRRGLKFATYAVFRIRGAIQDAARQDDPLARHDRARLRRFQVAEDQLEAWGQLSDRARLARLNAPMMRRLVSLTTAASRDLEAETLDMPDLSEWGDPEAAAIWADEVAELATAKARLNERQRLILRLHYDRHQPFHQIADRLGLSESRVCQLHKKAIERLRQHMLAA